MPLRCGKTLNIRIHQFAKRQMTWFAREPEIHWIDVDAAGGVEGAAEAVHKLVTQEGLIE